MKLKLLVSALFAAGMVSGSQVAMADDDDRDDDGRRHGKRAAAAALDDCCTAGDADFPKVGGNLGNQNYSSLKDIHRGNIKTLGAAWLNRIEGGLNDGTNQSTPVVVDGVLYLESALGNVVAVDGQTGATKWNGPTPAAGSRAAASPWPRTSGSSTRWRTATAVRARQGDRRSRMEVRYRKSDSDPAFPATSRRSRWSITTSGSTSAPTTATSGAGARSVRRDQRRALLSYFWGIAAAARASSATTPGAARRRASARGAHAVAASGDRPGARPGLTGPSATCAAALRRTARHAARAKPVRDSVVALDLKTGRVQVALPVGPPRHLGHGQRHVAGAGRTCAIARPRCASRVVYGSKTGMYLHPRPHRRLGAARHRRGAGARQDARPGRSWPTQPRPAPGRLDRALRASWTEPLGGPVPGDPNRAVPNYRQACLYDAALGRLAGPGVPGHGGGADWSHQSFSQSTKLVYTGFGYVRRGALADRGEQRPAAAGRVPDRRHRRGRPGTQPVRGRSTCRTRSRTATAS